MLFYINVKNSVKSTLYIIIKITGGIFMNIQVAKGMKAVWIEKETHKKMKMFAAMQGTTVQDLSNQILLKYIKRNGGAEYVSTVR